MANEVKTPIPTRIYNAAEGGHVAGADDIYDDDLQKKQSDFNSEVCEALGTGGTVDDRIANAVNTEKERAESAEGTLGGRLETLEEAVGDGGSVDERIAAEGAKHYTKEETYNKTELNNLITTPNQGYITVDTYASLPATGSADTIYRVSNYDGSTSQVDATKYSEYAWDGTQYVFLCVKTQIGEVFDITAYNSNTKYADLADALSGTNVPDGVRKGGMSVKFVQSSDNKYVQFRLMAQSFTTDTNKWQGEFDKFPNGTIDNILAGHYNTNNSNVGITYTIIDGVQIHIDGTASDTYQRWLDSSSGIMTGDGKAYYFDGIEKSYDVFLQALDVTDSYTVIGDTRYDDRFVAPNGHVIAFRVSVNRNAVVDLYITPIVSLWMTNKTATENIERIKSECIEVNAVKGKLNKTRTNADITFTVSNGTTIAISGTASGTASHRLVDPEHTSTLWVIDGDNKKYNILFDSTDENVYLQVVRFDADGSSNETNIKDIKANTIDCSFIATSGYKYGFKVVVSNGKTVNQTVSPVVSVVLSNESLVVLSEYNQKKNDMRMDNDEASLSANVTKTNNLKTKVDNRLDAGTDISRFYTAGLLRNTDQFSLYDAFLAYLNSIKFDTQCTQSRVRAFPESKFGHDSTLVVDGTTGYCVSLINNDNTGDNPKDVHALVALSIVDFSDMSVGNALEVAKNGDTVGDKTIISGAGVPNARLVESVLHIIYSAKLSDNKWYEIHRAYNVSSGTFGNNSVCQLSVSGNTVDFTTDAIYEYIYPISDTNDFISMNAQIAADGNGNYYAGMCVHTKIPSSVIMVTDDFVTWSVWLQPTWTNSVNAQYEGASIISSISNHSKLFYALRLNNGKTMLIARIDLNTKAIEEEYLLPDCGSRPCWYVDNGSNIHLTHSIVGRLRYEDLILFNNSSFATFGVWCQGLSDYVYPTVVMNGSTSYILSTSTAALNDPEHPGAVIGILAQKCVGSYGDMKKMINSMATLFNVG